MKTCKEWLAGEHADAHQKIAQHAPEEEQIPGGGQLARDDQGQIGPQQLSILQ